MNSHIFGRVIWGLVLVAAGVFFLLDQMGLIHIDIAYLFTTYWPAILIVYGLGSFFFQRKHHWGGSIWGLILGAVGTIFLLKNLQLTHLSISEMFQYLWPVALILFGLGVIFRPRRNEAEWEAKLRAREAKRAFKREMHNKFSNHWQHADWSGLERKEQKTPAEDEKRELSEDEKAVLKDIHGEFGAEKLRAPWDEPAQPAQPEPSAKFETPLRRPHIRHEHKHHYHDFVRNFDGGDVVHRHGFIGDVHLGQDPWELKPVQISHFIGDSVIDLTSAVIPVGETPIQVTAFIGDVKIFIPNDIDVEVRVMASSFIGDMKVLDRRESGFLRSVRTQTSHYEEAERKLVVTTSMFIGDVTIKRIG
ncbi:cell wall-active antibiotics response protein LiaF [Paenibacillus aestuarii]|uniref:Cell wall-active antibiotics response protein LiaF n=1 Tax=Paenibacillus aestuarii TaxID=516965 RepID=A0ABW0K7Z2_9BACL|nr:cell wall-active antibiotics response protein LiaF [Paenibacillus aestuarii]